MGVDEILDTNALFEKPNSSMRKPELYIDKTSKEVDIKPEFMERLSGVKRDQVDKLNEELVILNSEEKLELSQSPKDDFLMEEEVKLSKECDILASVQAEEQKDFFSKPKNYIDSLMQESNEEATIFKQFE